MINQHDFETMYWFHIVNISVFSSLSHFSFITQLVDFLVKKKKTTFDKLNFKGKLTFDSLEIPCLT